MISSAASSFWHLSCCLALLSAILPFPSEAADPDPLQDICVADYNASFSVNGFPCRPRSEVKSEDFFLDLSRPGNTTNEYGFAITGGDVLSWPGLNTQGHAIARVDLARGGISLPHTHPRATESGVVTRGKLLVGFVTTSNVLYYKVLTPGMVFVIPRALLHFQLPVGKEKVVFFATFNSQNPGTQFVASSLFNTTPPIPDEVLTKSFLVKESVIDLIRSVISRSQFFVTGGRQIPAKKGSY